MTHSYLTVGTSWTSDRSSREGVRVQGMVIHHAATTSLQAILSLFQPGGRTVSANYALKDGQLIATVPEEYRAWTTASGVDDRRAVTIEVANSQAGDPWPVSEESFHTLARLIADVSQRYGFEITDDTVLTHQEVYLRFHRSYATACPGDLQRRKGELLNLARHYRGQGPAPAASPSVATRPVGRVIVSRSVREIQTLVGAPVDGQYGPDTTAKVIAWQAANGLEADGIWGKASDAKAFGAPPASGPGLAVDGQWGTATTKALQAALGVTADGIIGPNTRKALQRKLGVTADGIWGPNSKKALQRHLGVAVDGIWGYGTISALQRRLNAGNF